VPPSAASILVQQLTGWCLSAFFSIIAI